MNKTGLVVILLALLGLVWLYFASPASAVAYSFTAAGIGGAGESAERIKIVLIADIHLRETPREEITEETETRAILEAFVSSVNDDVKPDFIVQLGDLNDGCLANCGSEVSDELVIDRLLRAQQYTEDRTDITWFDVIGNHEYASGYRADLSVIENKDFGAVYRAINKDWSVLEDTWYYRDIKGYRFVFLNTSFPHAGASHLIPQQQVDWLEQVLETSLPTFVFMHVPVSDGAGNAYDIAVNQEKISALLASDDSFVAGFFGHSHHSDNWDGLRRQLDRAGNVFFHVPAPHQWLGNRSHHPWVIVTIEPGADRFTVEVGAAVKRSELSEFAYFIKERVLKLGRRLTASYLR